MENIQLQGLEEDPQNNVVPMLLLEYIIPGVNKNVFLFIAMHRQLFKQGYFSTH